MKIDIGKEPIFSNRLLPVLAAPGVVFAAVGAIYYAPTGMSVAGILGTLLGYSVMFGFVSVVVLSIPLWVFAKFKMFRLSGLSGAKALGATLIAICAIGVAMLLVRLFGYTFTWLFEGSKFFTIALIAWIIYLVVYMPYNAYQESKKRNALRVIDTTPSRSRAIVKK